MNRKGGLRSRLRSGLNRLVRESKGYSKSVELLAASLALVWQQQWAKFNATAM